MFPRYDGRLLPKTSTKESSEDSKWKRIPFLRKVECSFSQIQFQIRIEVWEYLFAIMSTVSWKRKWQPTPVILPGKSYRQRSLAGATVHGVRRVGHDRSNSVAHAKFLALCLAAR